MKAWKVTRKLGSEDSEPSQDCQNLEGVVKAHLQRAEKDPKSEFFMQGNII